MIGLLKASLTCSILLFLAVATSAVAQDTLSREDYTYSIGGSISKGFIIRHDKSIGHLAQSHPTGFSVFLKKHTFGKRDWEKVFHYPDIGLVFDYFDYHNPMLGQTFSTLGFLDYYLSRKQSSALTLQLGMGLCYATNPYNPETNNKNIAIGSSFTYALRAQLAYQRQILSLLDVMLAIRLSHYSNGAFKMPNKGINVPTIDLGLSYRLGKQQPVYQHFSKTPTYQEDIKFNFVLASGIKEIDPIGGDKFPFFTFSFFASKQVSLSNSFNLGFDGFYSLATKEERAIDRNLEGKNPDFKRIGLVGGHELILGKLSLLTQLGIYLYRPYKTDKAIYQRYGLKYDFGKHFFGIVSLKSHYGKADAVEWGIGITL